MSKKIKTPTNADMKKDREFAIKIALFNSLLFCFLIAAVTYVDARLKTHVPFGASGASGARTYRWGYIVSGVGGLLVLLGTSLSLGKVPNERWKLKSAFPTAILLIVGAASLPFFRPDLEFPHGGITTWTVCVSFVSLLSCGIHYPKFRTDWAGFIRGDKDRTSETIREPVAYRRGVDNSGLPCYVYTVDYFLMESPLGFCYGPFRETSIEPVWVRSVSGRFVVRAIWHCL